MAIFAGSTGNLLQYGAGIALPIAALGVFVGLRTWSVKISREADTPAQKRKPAAQKITENE